MADKFQKFYAALESPADHAANITPADGANLSFSTRGLYVGNTGNVNCIFVGDTANTVLPFVPAGTLLPFRIRVVHSSGTTASNIVGLW
jgi:hypothetical protein